MGSYFKQSDSRLTTYYNEHQDIFKQLKPSILTFLKKFMNDYSVHKLLALKHIEENGYKFKGVTGGWVKSYADIRFKVNSLELTSEELYKYLPTQAIFITHMVYTLYNDIKYMAYLVVEEHVDEYINEYTKCIDDVLSKESKVYEIKYCRKFHALGLAIPSILHSEYMKIYRDVILSSQCELFYNTIGDSYTVYKDSPLKLISKINSRVMSGEINVKDKEMALIAKSYRDAYSKCVLNGIETVESLLGMAKRTVYKTQAKNGLRLATVGELESRISQLVTEEEFVVSETNYNNLVAFVYLCTSDDRVLAKCTNVNGELDTLLKLDKRDLLIEIAGYINSEEFTIDLDKMLKLEDIKYPETAPDEIRDMGLTEKLTTVKASLEARDALSKYEEMALDIANKGFKGKMLSDKQVNILNRVYSDIVTGKYKDNLYTKDVENKIIECSSYFTYRRNEFIKDLFDSVTKYKKCSEKQLKCIEDEYDRMEKHKESLLKTGAIAGSEGTGSYVVNNKRNKKSDENRAIEELELQDRLADNKAAKSTVKSDTKSSKSDGGKYKDTKFVVVFGDYVFEDTED